VGAGGGGVGLYGQGASGAGGTSSYNAGAAIAYPGGGGSGAPTSAQTGVSQLSGWPSCSVYGNGGSYGGGGGTTVQNYGGSTKTLGLAGPGAVRIVWPGNTRQFPSTCVGAP
jgi:hypothetical protein